MREMKDSGVPWIGLIPDDWNLIRLKSVIKSRTGGAWGEEETGASGDTICLRIADFNYNKYRFTDSKALTVRNYKEETIKKLTLRLGDILIEKSGGGEKTPVGRAVIFDKSYKALFANFMDRLCCVDSVNPYWILYNFANLYANNYTKPYIKQTTGIQNLDVEGLLSTQFAIIPSIEQQAAIVDKLDSKCAQIYDLISVQEKQIDKLKKYKQSLITKVVTKGLNPNAPMKDSGVEWVNEMPIHWDKVLLSSLVSQRKQKNDGMKENNLLSLSYGKVIRKNINTSDGLLPESFEGYNIIEVGDIVLRLTDLQNDHTSLRTGLCIERGIITSAYVTLVNNKKFMKSEYLHYYLHSFDICKGFYGMGSGVRQGLSFEGIKKLVLMLPPMNEQQEIVNFLNDKCAKIDALIEIKQKKIDKLNEYKKSLIYEYVTGKKEA